MRIVYVSHNSIGTPLVRSQVLPYLRLLAERGHEIDLVTFERGEPYPDGEFAGERWHPVRAHRGRSLLAKILDIVRGAWTVAGVARRRRADGLHARSYVAAAICWVVGRVLRRPYVFDMRGFMAEEYVDAGLWREDDIRHRALCSAEGHLLRGAAEIVVLTHAAARRLRTTPRYARHAASRPITVIPCTVDLERFRPKQARDPVPTVVYAGSLGTWYLLDQMVALIARARVGMPTLRSLFLNRGEHPAIRAAWAAAGLPASQLEIEAVDPREMPAQLGRAHVGIALLARVPSKIGSSPVKIAEYLACGLPVIVSEGIGDTDEQVRQARAGHVVASGDGTALDHAADALVGLVADEGARRRARALAEAMFDVRDGAAAYDRVYARLGSATR